MIDPIVRVRSLVKRYASGFDALKGVDLDIREGEVLTPLVFLGGSFSSIAMLPPAWQTGTLFNSVVYLFSGFRWSFFGRTDVAKRLSVTMILVFLAPCLLAIRWIFRTGWKLRK